MSVTVKGTGQKKSQSKESGLNIAGVSPTSGFFFTSPFRSLSTQGCFAKITLPAAGGDQVNGEFQREVRHAFAEAKLAGVKSPVLCGAIPFDTHQPSALFIPQQTQWFERDAFLADVTPPQDALPEITGKPKCLPSSPSCRWLPMRCRLPVATGWIKWCCRACWRLKLANLLIARR